MRKEGRAEAHPTLIYVILAIAVIFVVSVVSYQGIITGKLLIDDTGNDPLSATVPEETMEMPEAEEVGQQIEQMNQEIHESKGLIMKVISKAEISSEELIGSDIRVIPGEVTVNNVVVPTSVANLIVDVGEEHVRVKTTGTKVVIEDSRAEAIANEISIKNNALSVGGATIKVPPSEALSGITAKVVAIEIKEEAGKAVYMVRTEKEGKIFGLFAVKAHKEFTISANNGLILEESKGTFLWRFL